MTNEVAHKNLKVIIDKNAQGVAFGGAPAFLDVELDIFLNQAQNEIISNKFTGNNVLKQGFESSALRVSELDKLVMTDTDVYAVNTEYNEFVLDDVHNGGKRLIILQTSIYMQDQQAMCSLFDHDRVRLYKQTYCNIPWIENPVYAIEEPNQELDFSDDVMEEILNRAAVIALESIESQRATTKTQINQLSE